MTGTKFTPVHYRGAAPGITDLHRRPHPDDDRQHRAGARSRGRRASSRCSASAARRGLPQYPDVPTLAESGLPGFEAGSWYGLAAPKGTPREIVDKLNARDPAASSTIPAFREKFLAPSFIFLDRELAGSVRRAHPARVGEMGQGHPRRRVSRSSDAERPASSGRRYQGSSRVFSASVTRFDRLARLLLAFDFEERERAHRLAARRAGAACGTPRGSRRPRSVRCTAISVSRG